MVVKGFKDQNCYATVKVVLVIGTTFPILDGEHMHAKKEKQEHRF